MSKKIITFLLKLKENNNREWFKENKKEYDEARREFAEIIETLISELAKFNPSLNNLQIKDTVFRIYRDVRFSKDKSPYKIQMGAYIAPGGRKSIYAGYYVHFEPNSSFLAGGSYCPASDKLKNIRSEIYYNSSEFKSIIDKPDFKNTFGEIQGSKLVRPPVGFPKDFEDIELLKFKDFTVLHSLTNKEVESKDFINNAIGVFEKLNPFNEFINRALDS